MRRHLGVGRVVAEGGEEQLGQAHGAKDSGDGRRRASAARPAGPIAATVPSAVGPRSRHPTQAHRAVRAASRPSSRGRHRAWKASPLMLVFVVAAGRRLRLHQRLPRHGQRDRDARSRPGRSGRATAILMAAAFNFIGAFAGTAVAKTIGSGLVNDADDDPGRSSRPRSSARSPGTSSPGGWACRARAATR